MCDGKVSLLHDGALIDSRALHDERDVAIILRRGCGLTGKQGVGESFVRKVGHGGDNASQVFQAYGRHCGREALRYAVDEGRAE